jgi:8-oxo-dGTP pyrophosphatase MutT (NUDIX family)
MQFSYFHQICSKIKKIDLPGQEAQLILAPNFRRQALQHKYDINKVRKAGVLVLFYPDNHGDTNFVLILRKSYKGVHSGQVALPGGKIEDQDADLVETALRETEEEIGVKANTIEVLRPMTELYIPPSNFLVKPTLAKIDYTPKFIKQASEVEEVIPANLKDFLKKPTQLGLINTSYTGDKKVMSYQIEGHTVWGATAMMLSEMQVLLNQL